MKTENGSPLWGRARVFLETIEEVVQTRPHLIQDHFGSAVLLARHLTRLTDELNEVTNNKRGTMNLERCLKNDLKMDSALPALRKHCVESYQRLQRRDVRE